MLDMRGCVPWGGSMKRWFGIIVCVLGLALSGCSRDGARELYETAQFEELQNNSSHARELYQEILRKYPQSELAAKARERLDSLEGRR